MNSLGGAPDLKEPIPVPCPERGEQSDRDDTQRILIELQKRVFEAKSKSLRAEIEAVIAILIGAAAIIIGIITAQ